MPERWGRPSTTCPTSSDPKVGGAFSILPGLSDPPMEWTGSRGPQRRTERLDSSTHEVTSRRASLTRLSPSPPPPGSSRRARHYRHIHSTRVISEPQNGSPRDLDDMVRSSVLSNRDTGRQGWTPLDPMGSPYLLTRLQSSNPSTRGVP